MKELLLIPVIGAIVFLGSFVSEFESAWSHTTHLASRLAVSWRRTRWDIVFFMTFYGVLFAASLVAVRLLLF